eukprot:scaffold246108_cov17-Tisochrysis_lutea.AAC.1
MEKECAGDDADARLHRSVHAHAETAAYPGMPRYTSKGMFFAKKQQHIQPCHTAPANVQFYSKDVLKLALVAILEEGLMKLWILNTACIWMPCVLLVERRVTALEEGLMKATADKNAAVAQMDPEDGLLLRQTV